MIIEIKTIFKKTNYQTTQHGTYKHDWDIGTINKPELIKNHPFYTVISSGVIKNGDKFYEYNISHTHDFSTINEQIIQIELDKTLKFQKLILDFYEQNLINQLNDSQ